MALQCDRCLVITTFFNLFAPFHGEGSVARKLGFEWCIEDQRSNSNLLSEICRVFLIDRPYNQGLLPNDVLRVKTLEEAVDVVVETFERQVTHVERTSSENCLTAPQVVDVQES
jgi:hypothetical protein